MNDDQLYPDMTQLPAESRQWTEMSFFLIQTESCRSLHPVLDNRDLQATDALKDIKEKRKMIQQRREYLLAKFPQSSAPLSRLAFQHLMTAARKLDFVLQLREEIGLQKQKEAEQMVLGTNRLSFKLACESLNSAYVLLKGQISPSFRWFSNSYTPWYALVYVLRCLSSNSCTSETDPVWILIEELFSQAKILHSEEARNGYGHHGIWTHLERLYNQARSARPRTQLSKATSGTVCQSPSNMLELVPIPEVTASIETSATVNRPSTLSDHGHELALEASDPDFRLPFQDSMLETSFLSDWNTIFHGYVNKDIDDMDSTFLADIFIEDAKF